MLRKAVLMVFAAFAALPLGAQENMQFGLGSEALKDVSEGGQASLGTFIKIVREHNYERMGFDSPDEVQRASLGVPMMGYFVSLESLRSYQDGSAAGEFVEEAGQATFPVLVDGAVKSSITLVQQEGRWVTHSFGAPAYAGMTSGLRSNLAERMDMRIEEFFEVKAPALNVYFLGFQLEGKLMVAPLLDDARFGFKAGESIGADEAFEAMRKAAEEHEGLPS